MNNSAHQRWLVAAIIAGILYLIIAMGSSALAGTAASSQMQYVWRLSAFVMSGLVLTAHIAYEHFRLRSATRTTAWHASLGVAFGALALALAANIHDVGSAAGYRPRMLIAFVAWPLLTAVPAFVVSLVVAAVLNLNRRRA